MSEALRRDLQAHLGGEVRFDRVSRALYSTDASVYQIQPLGVVVPEDERGRRRRDADRAGARLLDHGAGRRHVAGRAVDRRRAPARHVEVPEPRFSTSTRRRAYGVGGAGARARRAERRARSARLRFAPDISTASRATIGGMIANNSSGARSVLYGKTIDHVLELDVVLSDGTLARLAPVAPDAVGAACEGDTLLAGCYRTVRRLGGECAEEIDRRFPKILRRVGGYNLDEFVDPARPFNLAKLIVGSEGTLGLVVAAHINLVPLPAAKAVLDDRIRRAARRARRDAGHPAPSPVGDRGDGPVHPRPRAREPGARRPAARRPAGRARRAPVRRALRRSRRRAPAATRGDRARPGRPGLRVPVPPRRQRRRSGADLEPARGRARALDGDEGRRQVAVVRRGHGGRPGEAARLHRPVPADRAQATARSPASTRTPRSAASTCGRS